MYSINSTSRRVTTFVEEEAYKWLYDKIAKNEYDASGAAHGQKVILDIKRACCVTRDTYEKFTSMVAYNPFACIVQGNKARNSKFIVTQKVENFFIKYNGSVLPIGFVRDFFEDDYETQVEVNKYIETIVKGQKERFDIQCQSAMLYKRNQAEELKAARPSVFNTALSFHVTNILKAILVIVTLVVCLDFMITEQVLQKVIGLFTGADNDAFFRRYWFHVVLNIGTLFFLIFRIIKLVKTVIFYVRLLLVRGGVVALDMSVKQLETSKLQELDEYFVSITPALARTHVISEDMYAGVPSAKRQYYTVMNFDFQKTGQRIANLYSSRHFAFLNAYYEDTEKKTLAPKKRSWRAGIAFNAVLCILLCFLNIAGLRTMAYNVLEPVLISLGFDMEGEEPESFVYEPQSDLEKNTPYLEFEGDNIATDAEYEVSQLFASNDNGKWDEEAAEDFPGNEITLKDGKVTSVKSMGWLGFHSETPAYQEKGYHMVEFTFEENVVIDGAALYFATSELGQITSKEGHEATPTSPDFVEILVYDRGSWTSLTAVRAVDVSTQDMSPAERLVLNVDAVEGSRFQFRFVGGGWSLLSEVELFEEAATR